MVQSVDTLLQALSWPASALSQTGQLTWTREAGSGLEMRILSASVVVSHDAIVCRVRSTRLANPGRLETHVEIAWDIRSSQPRLMQWMMDGQRHPLDEPTRALHAFRGAVQSLSVAPQFQAGGLRRHQDPEDW